MYDWLPFIIFAISIVPHVLAESIMEKLTNKKYLGDYTKHSALIFFPFLIIFIIFLYISEGTEFYHDFVYNRDNYLSPLMSHGNKFLAIMIPSLVIMFILELFVRRGVYKNYIIFPLASTISCLPFMVLVAWFMANFSLY